MKRIMIIAIVGTLFLSGSNILQIAGADDAPEVKWDKMFGGSGFDEGYFVQQTADGGYAVTGSISNNILLIKTDIVGIEEWNTTFDGGAVGRCLQQTTDGGYVLTGGISGNVLLLKTDSNGIKEWDKTFGEGFEEGYFVQQTIDGGYIITGVTWSYASIPSGDNWVGGINGDVWLIKTDEDGSEQWNRTFGRSGYTDSNDEGYCVQQTNDGGYILTGRICGDILLIKTDSNGIEEWNMTFDSGAVGRCLQQTTDGGYILTGSIGNSIYSYEDVFLIKTNSNGIEEWNKTFDFGEVEAGFCVQQTNDGGYILTGYVSGYRIGSAVRQSTDVLLSKTDSFGVEEWNLTLCKESPCKGYSVQQINDEEYIIAGSAKSGALNSDVWLVKVGARVDTSENGGDGGKDSGTPGFGILIAFFAITLILFWKRKRKK